MVRVALLHYRDEASGGGILRVGETLAKHLSQHGIAANLVFAYGGPGPVASQCSVPAHFLKAAKSSDWMAWIRARKFFREQDFDVIHFVDPVLWLSVATLGLRAKRVIHVHTRPIIGEPVSLWMQIWRRWLRYTSSLHLAITAGARKWAISLGWVSANRSVTLYNAVDVRHFERLPDRRSAREQLGLPVDAALLGFSARLVWWKGADDLLRVLERLPTRWHAVIAGEGPEESALRRYVASAGLTDRVHFVGFIDDPRLYLAAVDAVGFFSRSEPFGLVIAEAMAASVPVFGLLGEGEYFEPQNPLVTPTNAVFVPRASPQAVRAPEASEALSLLADRITDYGKHPELYREMIDQAHAWVRDRFDGPVQASKMAELYEQLVSAH